MAGKRRYRRLVALSAAVAALGGCELTADPQPSEEQAVEEAVTTLITALKTSDAETACAQMTDDLQGRIVARSRIGTCEELILSPGAPPIPVGEIHEVEIDAAEATVDLVDPSRAGKFDLVQLVKVGDVWKVASY